MARSDLTNAEAAEPLGFRGLVVEVLTHYSKRARHYLEQYEAIQTALNNQPPDTTPTHSAVAPPVPRQRYRLADRLGGDTLDKLVARYEAGEPTTALAAEYGIAKSSLLRLLESRGVAMRQQRLTPKQKQRILRLRKQGMAIRIIAAKVGCSYGTAQAFLKMQSDLTGL
ncbi:hypothetical protein GCM10027449_14590 [Sinomonas notoginsengisoli]|uniref:helix-turn-helix domain-containing protein n=1 Tax=Sinomonas notoginsengisoli TaxID=1457311 RepID=UPI001F2AAECC|nr:helix-turn-helix domain-containing protein [Sinomonas notoginsengisoli]